LVAQNAPFIGFSPHTSPNVYYTPASSLYIVQPISQRGMVKMAIKAVIRFITSFPSFQTSHNTHQTEEQNPIPFSEMGSKFNPYPYPTLYGWRLMSEGLSFGKSLPEMVREVNGDACRNGMDSILKLLGWANISGEA
jgi:putative component of membrane protein insertase Oxa1/YidC/SpoIIIJ protein YidD